MTIKTFKVKCRELGITWQPECYVDSSGHDCDRAEKGSVMRYNFEAPDGFRFAGENLHMLVCFGMQDAIDRIVPEWLEKCPDDCDCKE